VCLSATLHNQPSATEPDRMQVMSHEYKKAMEECGTEAQSGNAHGGAMSGGFGGWTRWSEETHTKTDIRECTDQHCMNVEVNCGFQGLDPDSPLSQSAGVSDDLRAAWRAKLDGEGKPSSGTRSLKEIIFGTDSDHPAF
jgi:hypothetical protein